MKKWLNRAAHFYQDKIYMAILCLTAIGSYGFLCTHSTVGIDDTPYAYYFEEGLIAIVGRWVLYLLNKVIHIADYAPFLTDFAGVLLLMAAAIVWSALFYSVLGDRVPKYGYLFFACIFLSCPLISEVYTYHLHNGISIGYLCSGISLCFLREGYIAGKHKQKGGGILLFLASAVFLWIALGCYESFMVVWLVGVCLLLLTTRFSGEKDKVFVRLVLAGVTAFCGLILRSIMIVFVTKVFGLTHLQDEAVQRSVTEMVGWILEPGAFAEFAMVLKRVFVMYGVFAYAYYPIKIFLLAAAVMGLYSIWKAVKQKDIWIVLLLLATFVAAFLLVFVEGKATLYRSAQFLPVICGYGALIFVYAMKDAEKIFEKVAARFKENGKSVLRCVAILILSVILWNQCADMNKWFYVDYKKYEVAQATVAQVAGELGAGFDTGKPLTFTGVYEIPGAIIEDAYVPYGSETFFKMNRITTKVDEHLLEKFYRSNGVWVAQTPSLSVIEWGRTAFGSSAELVRFMNMEGYSFQALTDETLIQEATEYSYDMPRFPAEGSIVDMGEYIIVNF